jgi:hypothetical protein
MDNLILECAMVVLAGCSGSAGRMQEAEDGWSPAEAGRGPVEDGAGGASGRTGATAPESSVEDGGGGPGTGGRQTEAGRAGESGAPTDQCEPLARDEACGDRTCGEVEDGCGSVVGCGVCPEGLGCVAGLCERSSPAACEYSPGDWCEAIVPEPEWDRLATWRCEPGGTPAARDCINVLDRYGAAVSDSYADVWCCR